MDRSHNSKWAWATLLIGGPILITAFQNCGQLFEDPLVNFDGIVLASTGNLQAAGGCETQIIAQYNSLYRSTYYPYLTSNQNCAACHSGSGPGIGAFSYPDVTVSGSNFISRFARINQNARSTSHASGFTGSAEDIAAINSYEPQWSQAIASYQQCLNQAAGGGGGGSGLTTSSKSNAQIMANSLANNANFVTLSWDLSTEIITDALRGRIPATLTIDVRVATIGGVRRGYEFRNPSIRLNANATSAIRVSNLSLYINNFLLSDVTTYSFVDSTINSTAVTNLSPGSAVALAVTSSAPVDSDVFSIQIGTVRENAGTVVAPGTPTPTPTPTPTLPTTVTLAQLLGNDPALNVFAASCVSCHNAGNARGGLDLTNAAQARANAADSRTRMNNPANPMPPGGLLPQGRRDLVNIWVQTGAN